MWYEYKRHIRSETPLQRICIVTCLYGITEPPVKLYNSYQFSKVCVILLHKFTVVNSNLQILCKK